MEEKIVALVGIQQEVEKMRRPIASRAWKKFGEPVGIVTVTLVFGCVGAIAWLVCLVIGDPVSREERKKIKWQRS